MIFPIPLVCDHVCYDDYVCHHSPSKKPEIDNSRIELLFPFIKDGQIAFEKSAEFRGKKYYIDCYATFGSVCPNDCMFCRNKSLDGKEEAVDSDKFEDTLLEYSKYIKNLTLGGGEPLLYLSKIKRMQDFNEASKLNIVTSGIREIFLKNKLVLTETFDKIYLSRHHFNEAQNSKIFGVDENSPLLTNRDIKRLPASLKEKITLFATCFEHGGLAHYHDLISYIEWAESMGINSVLFNNLSPTMTPADFVAEHATANNLFDKTATVLTTKKGYQHTVNSAYSGGYDIKVYEEPKKYGLFSSKPGMVISFKTYHENKEQTDESWLQSNSRIYDLSLMPDGKLYADFDSEQELTRLLKK